MESESSTACILCKDAQPSSANDSSGLDDNVLIQCDSCGIWYHIGCVNLQEFEVENIDRYHCEKCNPNAGPIIYKVFTNTHRNDPCEVNAQDKPMECGTIDFLKILKEKTGFHNTSDIIIDLENGHNLDVKYLESTSFDRPILVRHSAGLDLSVPDINSVDDLESWLDDTEFEVDVIDSQRQKDYSMKFSTLLAFFRQKNRKRIYNLISMEFSKTKLSPLVILPKIVDDISWVHQYWPKSPGKSTQDDLNPTKNSLISQDSGINDDNNDERPLASFASEHAGFKPEVSKFCLISMKDSYTDFHIDFGGSSVWYHILWGEKIFYVIEPTESNLMLYDEWMKASNKSERFFGDEVEKCYVQKLSAGHTFFIPTGWIHAVLTPSDSLVFGGNFLQGFNIPLQLKIYEMELGCSMYEKYMFPNFELVNWYAGYNFIELLNELNEEKVVAKRHLEVGIPALIDQMKKWLQNKRDSEKPYVQKIESLTFPRLVAKLEKVFKTNQKIRIEQRQKRAIKLSNVAKNKQVHSKPKVDASNNCRNLNEKVDDSLMKLAFRSSVFHIENENFKSTDQKTEMSPSENTKNVESVPPLKLTLCVDNMETSTGDSSKENNEASLPKEDLKITLSLKSKEKSGQKRKYAKTNEKKSSKKTNSYTKNVSKKQSESESFNEDELKNGDLKVETVEEQSAADLKNTERLNSIFAVSKHGRVPKVNKNINIDLAVLDDSRNHKEYACQNNLDDEEDEDFSDEELLQLKSAKSKIGAPYLHLLSKPKKKFHDVNPRKSIECASKDETSLVDDMKIKKKKQPSTVKQRLAMKLKIK